MRLIDADKFVLALMDASLSSVDEDTILDLVDSIHTVDAVPVVHGMWIPSESDFDDDDALFDVEEWCDWQCSVCHDDICYDDPMGTDFLPKFCPNCGAKMNKKEATYD